MAWNDIPDSVLRGRSLRRQGGRRPWIAAGLAVVGTAVVFALVSPGSWAQAPGVDLSPARWPEGEFEQYSERHYNYDLPRVQGVGRHGLIAGTSCALAVRSGLEALKQGGSAADAALVTAMAQITLSAGFGILVWGSAPKTPTQSRQRWSVTPSSIRQQSQNI